MKVSTKLLGMVGLAALSAAVAGSAIAQDRVLKVTNWAEYIAEDTIANFEAEYGIKVIYDTYDSQEAIDAKLLAGNSGYDVVSHSSSAGRATDQGRHRGMELDKSKLDNMKNMDEALMNSARPQTGTRATSTSYHTCGALMA